MKITSNAFSHEGRIPSKYTCEGEDVSPPLSWSDAPEGVKSFVLINDDPDAPDPAAPKMTWVHWVIYDLPPDVTELSENQPPSPTLPNGGVHGITNFKRPGYGGPCPPIGTHRYFFKLYALDSLLGLPPGRTKDQVLAAMYGHILEEAVLMGTYSKNR